MTKWTDPLVLLQIMSVVAAIVIPILVVVLPTCTWIETHHDESKPVEEIAQSGEPVPAEDQGVKTEALCSEYYPDFCVKPDYDCSDIPVGNFTVKEPDPMNFDRDGNGRGCE